MTVRGHMLTSIHRALRPRRARRPMTLYCRFVFVRDIAKISKPFYVGQDNFMK